MWTSTHSVMEGQLSLLVYLAIWLGCISIFLLPMKVTTAFGKLQTMNFKFHTSLLGAIGLGQPLLRRERERERERVLKIHPAAHFCTKTRKNNKIQTEILPFRRHRRPDARGRHLRRDISLPGRVWSATRLLPPALQLSIPTAARHQSQWQDRQQEGLLRRGRSVGAGKWFRKCLVIM